MKSHFRCGSNGLDIYAEKFLVDLRVIWCNNVRMNLFNKWKEFNGKMSEVFEFWILCRKPLKSEFSEVPSVLAGFNMKIETRYCYYSINSSFYDLIKDNKAYNIIQDNLLIAYNIQCKIGANIY